MARYTRATGYRPSACIRRPWCIARGQAKSARRNGSKPGDLPRACVDVRDAPCQGFCRGAAVLESTTMRTASIVALSAAAALAAACGGQTTNDDSLGSKGGASTAAPGAPTGSSSAPSPPACRWTLPDYEQYARSEACVAARAYVACDEGGGATRSSMSDALPTAQNCRNECESATEYAVTCGADGFATLPPRCRQFGAALSGPKASNYFCCPCE